MFLLFLTCLEKTTKRIIITITTVTVKKHVSHGKTRRETGRNKARHGRDRHETVRDTGESRASHGRDTNETQTTHQTEKSTRGRLGRQNYLFGGRCLTL